MMNSTQAGVLLIIKSALTGEKYTLPNDFDLAQAAKIARKHQIIALFYYGALNCGISDALPEMQTLFMQTCSLISLSERQNFEINRLFKLFEENKIDYLPLKGTLLKRMYPKSEMRIMSDADILIRTEQHDAIRPIMLDLGYAEKIESNHEFVWEKGNIVFELHKRLIPSYNKDYYNYYGDGWRLAVPSSDNCTRYEMSAEDEMIYIFTHYAKHYRDAGVGIKHILDLWVYKSYKPELDNDYILAELKKLQLDVFYKHTMNTLEVWFGNGTPTEQTKLISDVIFNSGVYGTHRAHVLSDAVKISKTVGSSQKTKLKKTLEMVFLPYSSMTMKYPFLKKAPVLLPIMWVVRWFEAIFIKKGAIRNNRDNLKILSVENIDDYQSALNFVGLDFNFKE